MIILKSRHTNNSGATFHIEIYDRDSETSPEIEFKCNADFFKLKWLGSNSDPFQRIIPTSVEFTVLTGSVEYTESQNNAILAFYEQLTTTYEGRFYVRVRQGSTVLFRGKILPDVGDYLLGEQAADFVVTAIDGIVDLRTIEYRPIGYTDLLPEYAITTNTFNEHFADILRRIDTVDYFVELLRESSIAYSLFATSAHWTAISPESVAGDIFDQVMVRNFWYEQKSTGTYRKYANCWDVLMELLTGFNARLYYDRGMYVIEQIGYMDNIPANIDIYHKLLMPNDTYTEGTAITKIQHNYDDNDNLQAGRGATQKKLPAFKAVELENSKSFFNYINGLTFSIPDNPGPFELGEVIGTGNKLVMQFFPEILLPSGWSAAAYATSIKVEHILTMKLQIGDLYIVADDPIYAGVITLTPNGQFQVSSGGKIPTLNWTLVEGTVTIKWERTFVTSNVNDFNAQASAWRQSIIFSDMVIETNEIQEDGVMIVEFVSFVTKRNGVTIGGFPPGTLSLKKNSRIIVANGYNDLYEQPKGIKRYEIGDTRNSIIYPIKFGFYDSYESRTSQLFIKAAGQPNSNLYPSNLWNDPDSALTLPIQDMVLKQMLAMRAIPTNSIKMMLFYKNTTQIGFGDQIVYNDIIHIPITMELIANGVGGYTAWNTVMWAIYKDYAGINVLDVGEIEIDPSPFPLPDGTLDAASYPGSLNGLHYWQEWENISTAWVELTDELSLLVDISEEFTTEIRQKWHFFINGVKQRYIPTGTLVLSQWRFDIDNNRIVYVKGSGSVRHLEIFKYY